MTTDNEVMIAGVRKQKDLIDTLVLQLENRPRLRRDDLLYMDSVLKDVEHSIHELRKSIK